MAEHQWTPEELQALAALAGIRSRLDTLASINASNILIPGGPQERYHVIIDEAYAALGLIEAQVDTLREELKHQHVRLDESRNAALGKEAPKKPVEERLKTLLANILEVPEKDIVPSADLVNDLDASSIGLVEIFLDIQDEFGVRITDDEFMRMLTVGEILDFLYRKDVM